MSGKQITQKKKCLLLGFCLLLLAAVAGYTAIMKFQGDNRLIACEGCLQEENAENAVSPSGKFQMAVNPLYGNGNQVRAHQLLVTDLTTVGFEYGPVEIHIDTFSLSNTNVAISWDDGFDVVWILKEKDGETTMNFYDLTQSDMSTFQFKPNAQSYEIVKNEQTGEEEKVLRDLSYFHQRDYAPCYPKSFLELLPKGLFYCERQ